MVLCGVDPGSTWCGWALVQANRRAFGVPPFVYLCSGKLPSRPGDLERVIGSLPLPVDAVVVETPGGAVFSPARSGALLQTARVAGIMAADGARLVGLENVFAIDARTARSAIVRKVPREKGAMDRAIKSALGVMVDHMPARSSVHVRDAIAVAVGAKLAGIVTTRRPPEDLGRARLG